MDIERLSKELERDERRELHLYRDSVGKWTIGVGHNLSDLGISDAACDLILHEDIQETMLDLDKALPWWRSLDEVRQRAVANMAFNLGIVKLCGFKQTLSRLQAGDYLGAAQSMLQSKWATQVGPRAERLAVMVRDGGPV